MGYQPRVGVNRALGDICRAIERRIVTACARRLVTSRNKRWRRAAVRGCHDEHFRRRGGYFRGVLTTCHEIYEAVCR